MYRTLRNEHPRAKVAAAVRFLYLNRTAFAGMYRLNQNGEFNVPYGGGQRRPDVLWQDGLLSRASAALRRADLRCGDFEEMLASARPDDLVYCDPTYTVTHNNNGFIRYNEANFRWSDQQRLARICSRLQSKGTTVVVSNAFHNEVRILYPTAKVFEVDRLSLLCPKADKRKPTKEYLFLLKP
jgi:DNA adenine methylase